MTPPPGEDRGEAGGITGRMDAAAFTALARHNPVVRALLARLPELGLNDCWLVSGCLFQTVWNVTTGRAPTHGISDYDIFYFDDEDLSWEAEDAWIRTVEAAFADLPARIEVRNQARVHLWYGEKFGLPYPPLTRPTDSIDRFLAKVCMVGLAPVAGSAPRVYAPAGYGDMAAMVVRPNYTENFQARRFYEKAVRWRRFWPELTIVAPEAHPGAADKHP